MIVQRPEILFCMNTLTYPDCDCACGMPYPVPNTSPPPLSGVWQARQPALTQSIERGTWWAYYVPTATTPVTVMNAAAQRLWSALSEPRSVAELASLFDLPRTDVEAPLATMARVGLIRPWEAVEITPPLEPQPTTLTAWLYLTQQCNLRCPYCYVPHRNASMDEATARAAIAKLTEMTKRHGYRRIKIKYAGGEPTLRFDLIRSIQSALTEQSRAAGLEAESVVLTNGTTWNEERLDFIAEHGIHMAISIDGGAEAHNRLRAFPNGRGSYEKVLWTIEKALERRIEITLSLTITAWNLDGVSDVVRLAMEKALPFNLNFVRERQPQPWVPEAEALAQALHSAFRVMEQHIATYPHPLTASFDRARFDFPHTHTCAAGRDYIAILPDGRIAPCHMETANPLSIIEATDPLAEVRRRSKATFAPTVDDLPDCATCPWRYACGGGCPLLRGTELHRRYCRIYRRFYPELIRLEGLRLLYRHRQGPLSID